MLTPISLTPSFGFGDRLGLATPGQIAGGSGGGVEVGVCPGEHADRTRVASSRITLKLGIRFGVMHLVNEAGGELRGVPATGYLVEFSGKRWLFPGDTRLYDASRLPDFGPLDGLVAHLWLGRGGALLDSPPLLADFSRFCLALQPERILLAHLQEYGRDADDFWDESHLPAVLLKFQEMSPGIRVEAVLIGESLLL